MDKIKSITINTVDGRAVTITWAEFSSVLESVLSQAITNVRSTLGTHIFAVALGDDITTKVSGR